MNKAIMKPLLMLGIFSILFIITFFLSKNIPLSVMVAIIGLVILK